MSNFKIYESVEITPNQPKVVVAYLGCDRFHHAIWIAREWREEDGEVCFADINKKFIVGECDNTCVQGKLLRKGGFTL